MRNLLERHHRTLSQSENWFVSRLQISRLHPSGYLRTPWKNGGGIAVGISGASIRGEVLGAWEGMIWSFGRTAIVKAAPFSDLTGLDRMQMVVEGRGLVLKGPSEEIDLRLPGLPVRFSGSTPIVSHLENGSVEVVNLIGRHQLVELDLRTLEYLGSAVLKVGDHVIYAAFEACTLSCGGAQYMLSHDHALLIKCGEDVVFCRESGRAVIASIFMK